MLNNPYVTMALMALAVYSMRSSGYWLAGRFRVSSLFRTWLGYLPGCLMVSIVAPIFIKSSPVEWVGAIVTGVTMVFSENLLISMVSGIVTVIVLRLLMA